MADRYWVVGTGGTWDSTAGTKWATTSGGAGGASVPGTGDQAIFDANSGSGVITKGATALTVGSFNATGFTGTFAWGGRTITVDTGDWNMGSTATMSVGGGLLSLTFTGTTDQTLTHGAALGTGVCNGLIRGGASGTTQKLIFADASDWASITLNRAVLDLNGTVANTGTFTFGAGAITRSLNFGAGAWLKCATFTANTGSGFSITNAGSAYLGLDTGNCTINATTGLSMPNLLQTNGGSSALIVNSGSSVPSICIIGSLTLAANLTCTGPLWGARGNSTGTAAIKSDTGGVARTLTVNGGVRLARGYTVTDITAAGGTFLVPMGTDGGGNTSVTFGGDVQESLLMSMGVG